MNPVELNAMAVIKLLRIKRALERLLDCPDLYLDSLEPETIRAVAIARARLDEFENAIENAIGGNNG